MTTNLSKDSDLPSKEAFAQWCRDHPEYRFWNSTDIAEAAWIAGRKAIAAQTASKQTDVALLVEALKFYADGAHFVRHDPTAWDTVSGEPINFYEDESNTATVENGSVAKMALANYAAPPAQAIAVEAAKQQRGGIYTYGKHPNGDGYVVWDTNKTIVEHHHFQHSARDAALQMQADMETRLAAPSQGAKHNG